MSVDLQRHSPTLPHQRGRIAAIGLVLLVLAFTAFWIWRQRSEPPKTKAPAVVPVVSTLVTAADVPVRLVANGTVTALQSVEVRPQISATIKRVHIREGQFVRQGDRLFSLDVRTEDANLGRTRAQVVKARADLANAERNLQRQRELFEQKFVSQTALDTVRNQVDSLRAQVAADLATVESSRVARGFGEILAPISGRTGAVAVYPGSLVQAASPPLLSITQLDPIGISFTLPERELPALQDAIAEGEVAVSAQIDGVGQQPRSGRLVFVDNSVDSASGTIRVKANFANADGRLWPGMFVNVALSPRTIAGALTVPVQAVQTGPEKKFLYVIDEQGKTSAAPIRVLQIQDGRAVVEGVSPGTRVVVEGAQNLRPGSKVSEAGNEPTQPARKSGKP